MVRLITHITEQTWVHVTIGFVLMGAWSIYANWGHPMPKPLVAGLVQGAASGIITYLLKRVLDELRNRVTRNRGWWLPPFIACSISLCLLLTLHLLTETPEVVRTISVPFTVATTYAFVYNILKWRKEPTP